MALPSVHSTAVMAPKITNHTSANLQAMKDQNSSPHGLLMTPWEYTARVGVGMKAGSKFALFSVSNLGQGDYSASAAECSTVLHRRVFEVRELFRERLLSCFCTPKLHYHLACQFIPNEVPASEAKHRAILMTRAHGFLVDPIVCR